MVKDKRGEEFEFEIWCTCTNTSNVLNLVATHPKYIVKKENDLASNKGIFFEE